MITSTLSGLALLSGLAYSQFAPPAGVSNVSSSACPSNGGAHIIVARASLEAPGYGIIGSVKDAILSRVPGSTAEFVTYPATLNDYFNSESAGVVGMRTLIANYVAKCSSSLPLVIMGYSQGAQVTADALVGQQTQGFPANSSISDPLPASTLSRIAAVVMMGDPTFVTNETFHVGNATRNGVYPRRDVANFNIANLAQRTKSYCDANDPYCAGGNLSTGLAVHLGYVKEYGNASADFVINQIKAYTANGGASNGTATGSGGATSSSSGRPASYTGAAATLSVQMMPIALLAGSMAWLL